ncbi:CHASE2 domain-containing protein [Rhodoplanes sp. Z2-YC6860]|uniref:CHASE2 domain-containing protein n=1 Tax=Rhodoplanes sp. Z2-YC6860 TaxID=674703 RepID=UPI00078E62FE|nr:adenylate/guanylate cyclase domain-containing protein [Rhodoplanes sp. Z2-YC6860]AMN40734.1 sdenylate cyclase [Rhodoplanes sp. Z2-YC6860]
MNWFSHQLRRLASARILGAALLLALLFLRASDPSQLEDLRLRTFDVFQNISPRIATQHPAVIVDIDEKSLAKLGQWPWARTHVAELINKISQAGAAAIGFDIVFAEPDRLSPARAVDGFQGVDEETRNKLRLLPSNDQVFAEALKKSKTVLGITGMPQPVAQPEGLPPIAGLGWMGGDPAPFFIKYPGLLRNTLELEKAATGRGMFSIQQERDGIIRRVPMVMQAQGAPVTSLTFEMLRLVTGSNTALIRMDESGIKTVAVPGLEVPTDAKGRLWVYFARHDPALYVSAIDVLEGRFPADRFAQRLVLIGTSAAGLLDIKTTPLDPVIPGVEIHAQIIENLLSNTTLSESSYSKSSEMVEAFVLGVAIIILAPILGPGLLLLFGGTIIVLLIGTSWYFFSYEHLLVDFTFPLLSSSLIYLTLVFTNFVKEQAQRRQIRSAFGQYLSPALVEQLAQSPEKLVLGGEQREMTIMFSDVRGFTTISEIYKDDPQGLTALMNSFLTPLTNAILERKGTIDKYMGDAIMAFWSAPLHDANHELNACEAALEMLDRVERLNREREQSAKETNAMFIPIQIGVGLNTGKCVVGNMGSDFHFNYSVLGDSVNLASRLEGQCKSYGLPIIIGSRTASVAKDKFAMLELDFIAVKGKKEPEVVYALVGREDMINSERFRRWQEVNMKMLTHYRGRDWDAALAAIEEGRSADPEGRFKTLYEVYAERIGSFKLTPPPEDWDGAYALETK